MEEVKITSVEKVKDPKRVEAGKKLAAMSKQAKEKKAIENLSQKMSVDEFQIPSINPLAVVGVVGVVGVVVYYKYFNNVDTTNPKPKPVELTITAVPSPKEENPKRRELDTLD